MSIEVVVDIETTGLIKGVHEIVQLSVTHFKDFEITGIRFLSYVKPLKPELATSKAMEINGLDLDELQNSAATPGQVRMAFINWKKEIFGEDTKLEPMGHNYASFDKGFLEVFLNDWYDSIFSYNIMDTKILAKALIKAKRLEPISTSLKSLCNHFNIPYINAHDAYSDSLMTLKLYKELLNIIRS